MRINYKNILYKPLGRYKVLYIMYNICLPSRGQIDQTFILYLCLT